MGKPDDIEQRDWDAAGNEMGPPGVHVHPISYDLAHERIARAIATARDEGRAEQLEVRPLDEWHEDMGDVVWWCWRDGEWLGEPAYIGSPLDLGQTVEMELRSNQGEFVHQHHVGGWPGYHTHWTPHPAFPPAIRKGEPCSLQV